MSQIVNCPSCGAQNMDGARFCSFCGYQFPAAQSACPACGTPLLPNAMFCSACGARIQASVTPPAGGGYTPTQEAEPSQEQIDAMPIGGKVRLRGKEFTKMPNGTLMFEDNAGVQYVDAKSVFVSQRREKASSAPPQASERQPLWDPTVEDIPPADEGQQRAAGPQRKPEQPVSAPQMAQQPMNMNGFSGPQYPNNPPQTFERPSQDAANAYGNGQFYPPNPNPGQNGFTPSPDWGRTTEYPPYGPGPAQVNAFGGQHEGGYDDDDDDEEDDEDERVDTLTFLANRNKAKTGEGGGKTKKRKKTATHADGYEGDNADESGELARFQQVANQDGYYNDRRPLDEDTYFDDRRKIQWIPMILGIGGIILFLVVFFSFRNMF